MQTSVDHSHSAGRCGRVRGHSQVEVPCLPKERVRFFRVTPTTAVDKWARSSSQPKAIINNKYEDA